MNGLLEHILSKMILPMISTEITISIYHLVIILDFLPGFYILIYQLKVIHIYFLGFSSPLIFHLINCFFCKKNKYLYIN